jgi:hypothetical protein
MSETALLPRPPGGPAFVIVVCCLIGHWSFSVLMGVWSFPRNSGGRPKESGAGGIFPFTNRLGSEIISEGKE